MNSTEGFNPEHTIENGGSEKMERIQRVLAERLKEMEKKVQEAEAAQRDYIFKMAESLSEQQKLLLTKTEAYIGEHFEKKFHQLGAYAVGDQGTEAPGLQFDGKIGEVSCCSERRALFNFNKKKKNGEKVKGITTVRQDETRTGEDKSHYTESVGPCALCRDAIYSENKDTEVIQPIQGEVRSVSVSYIYPSRKLLAGEDITDYYENDYREFLLEISEDFPLTHSDEQMVERANELLQVEIKKVDKDIILVAATGFSGDIYTNQSPKLNRNPQSLVVDKPVEFQLVCEASENHDQLLTIFILQGTKQRQQKVMLPTGVSRELIRQFHPLTNVIVDFGKDGHKKLPIEVLYPLVYKLRKRKNGLKK